MKKLLILFLLVFNFLLSTSAAFAGEAKPLAEDPVLEARLKAMSHELRCLVCQNQTLADSNSPLAEDLRKEIRAQMRAGKSDQEVVDYLVARYGDFVRYRPPVNSNTALLWFGPFLLLLIGGFVLYRVLKKQAGSDDIQGEDG
ncbi:MAG TPA: cytochrome c-type biogenesis protein CcmH [Methylotenera sp.]|nr:cytochrome c-type biogenesis protein CcmH [Methylotenera sp.]HPV44336.1 cytochrome c-type biogenesis protein CcmH [Methylotenera sp.]